MKKNFYCLFSYKASGSLSSRGCLMETYNSNYIELFGLTQDGLILELVNIHIMDSQRGDAEDQYTMPIIGACDIKVDSDGSPLESEGIDTNWPYMLMSPESENYKLFLNIAVERARMQLEYQASKKAELAEAERVRIANATKEKDLKTLRELKDKYEKEV